MKRVNGTNGKPKVMKSYCRFFQTKPSKIGIICAGYQWYPQCPDYETCHG